MVTISTAGATLASPLGELRTRLHEVKGFRRDEAKKYNYARSDDGSVVLHEWCLADTDDPDDLKLVKKANPASWLTVTKLPAPPRLALDDAVAVATHGLRAVDRG